MLSKLLTITCKWAALKKDNKFFKALMKGVTGDPDWLNLEGTETLLLFAMCTAQADLVKALLPRDFVWK